MMTFFSLVMFALHRLIAVSSSEEAFNLRVEVIIMDRLDHIRIPFLILSVMELIWKATMLSMELSHWLGWLSETLARLEIVCHLLRINIIVDIRVSCHASRLINKTLRVFENLLGSLEDLLRPKLSGLSLRGFTIGYGLYRNTQRLRVSVALFGGLLHPRLTLIGFLRSSSLLLFVLFM